MYTQCPECETYFRVTADDLAAAEGQVRCSQCEAIFDARARLLTPAQEHALVPEAAEPAADADAAPATADDPGAPEAPEAADAAADGTDDDAGAAGAEPGDAPEAAGERTPDDEPAIGDLFDAEAPDAAAGDAGATRPPSLGLDDGFAVALDQRADPSLDGLEAPGASAGAPVALDDADLPRAPLGFELPTGASPILTDAGRPRPRALPWLAASAVLLLVLGAQLVHAYRETLARDPRLGPALVDAYRALDLPLAQPTDLARLVVQRADVTSHPVYRDVLYITATVTNEAGFAQPLPLLRVRLDDRWGEPVGVRIFRPEEYLRRAEPAARAEPGRAYAIALEVVDPGSEAVGYALTPCLPQGQTLVCLGDG